MVRQIYADYNIPIHPAEISLEMIHFFYDPLILGLIEIQKYQKKAKNVRL